MDPYGQMNYGTQGMGMDDASWSGGMSASGALTPGQGPMTGSPYSGRPLRDARGRPITDARKANDLAQLRFLLDSMKSTVNDTDARLRLPEDGGSRYSERGGSFVGGSSMMEGQMFGPSGELYVHITRDELPISEGVVLHKGGGGFFTRRKWKRQYMQIDGTNLILHQTADPESEPALQINIDADTQIIQGEERDHKNPEVKFTFNVVPQEGEELELGLSDRETAETWMNSLQYVVQRVNEALVHAQEQQDRVQMGEFGRDGMMMEGEQGSFDPLLAAEAEAEEQEETREHALRHVAYGAGISDGVRGEQTSFSIECRDEAGQLDPENANVDQIRAVLDSEELSMELNVEDAGDGTFFCTYTPPREGEYELRITMGGQDIYGSPFDLFVGPAPTAPLHCDVVGEGVERAIIGQRNVFRIITRNQFDEVRQEGGDQWEMEVHGPAEAEPINDLGNGIYECSYMVDLSHPDITNARPGTVPHLILDVGLVDPRYKDLSVDPSHPYKRPVRGSPFTPMITLPDAAPPSQAIAPVQTPWGKPGLSAGQLQHLAQGHSPERYPQPSQHDAENAMPASAAATPSSDQEGKQGGGGGGPVTLGPAPTARDEGSPHSNGHYRRSGGARDWEQPVRDAPGVGAAGAGIRKASGTGKGGGGGGEVRDHLREQLRDEVRHEFEEEQRKLDRRAEELRREARQLETEREEVARQLARVRELGQQVERDSESLAEFARLLEEQREEIRRMRGSGGGAGGAGGASKVPSPPPVPTTIATGGTTGPRAVSGMGVGRNPSGPGNWDSNASMADTAEGSTNTRPRGKSGGDLSREEGGGEDVSTPDELFHPDVIELFEEHSRALRDLFRHYAQGKDLITQPQFVRMMEDFDIIPTFTDAREVKSSFQEAARAHVASGGATIVENEGKVKRKLRYAAFVEAVGRVALVTLSKPSFRSLYPTPRQKVEVVLVMWCLADPAKLQEIKENPRQRSPGKKKKKQGKK